MAYDKPMCRNCRHWRAIDYHWGQCLALSYTMPTDKPLSLRVGATGPQDVYTNGVFA